MCLALDIKKSHAIVISDIERAEFAKVNSALVFLVNSEVF